MLVTIHHFPGHVIIFMSLSISRNWLCFDCCCVPCNRRGGGIFLPSPELELANLDSGSKWELGKKKANKRLSSLLTIRKEIEVRTVFPSRQGSGVHKKTLLFCHGQLEWSRN